MANYHSSANKPIAPYASPSSFAPHLPPPSVAMPYSPATASQNRTTFPPNRIQEFIIQTPNNKPTDPVKKSLKTQKILKLKYLAGRRGGDYGGKVSGKDESKGENGRGEFLSSAGEDTEENFFGGDYSDITSASESGWKDLALKKVITGLTKSRAPLSIKKTCPSFGKSHKRSNEDDWHFEVAVSKTHNASLPEFQNEESEGSSITKTLERTSTQDIGYEYVPMDEKEECSSGSNLVSDDLEGKFVTHSRVKGSSQKPVGRNQRFAAEEIGSEKQMYSERIHDRRSLDSTVTESSSHTPHGCCLQMANEVVCISKQLVEIETKQSNLMDLLQVLTSGILDSLSVFQTRVVGLEDVVNRLAQYFEHRREHSNLAASKLMKQSQNLRSPRLSTSIPRPSIDMTSRQPSMLSVKHSDTWEANTIGRSRTNNSAGHCTETWSNNRGKLTRNPIGKDIWKIPGQGTQRISNGPTRADAMFSSASNAKVRQNVVDSKNKLWKQVKGFLCEGDLDSAYVEALCSGDEIVLVELLEGTGPVLECLLPKTARDVLSTLASYLLEQRFINIIIPWLQQASAFIHYLRNIADLSTKRVPNYLGLPAKAKQEFLFSMEESLNMEFSNPSERRSVTQLAVKLHHLWVLKIIRPPAFGNDNCLLLQARDSQILNQGYAVLWNLQTPIGNLF
ncbi:hypothetical protein C1H46_005822 [Malus baccata]|uniref:TORTIFOLIA1/TORL1-2 C-terminal domain-containing protein n=1 Tax=Malus baccata TaxID=106549 RepID=A0A540NBV1_MALBA|nr:hypothetical protein C1H46_005822 [Malus baccata]